MIRLGFAGVGWIGRNRMEAILGTGLAEAVGIFDPSPEMASSAQVLAPAAIVAGSFDELLALRPDGVVIASPNALHADQSIRAFNSGAAVFCQKPLGRSTGEVESILAAARRADRLLGVDMSYRFTAAMEAIRELVRGGGLGEVFAAELVFHNAYGPGNAWFWNPVLSGGGCLIDLGVHLVDLALWLFDFPEVRNVHGQLFREGRPPRPDEVEDFALASFDLADGPHVRIACSWNQAAGGDAVIRAAFHGTKGGAEMRNVDGSYTDFIAERFEGRSAERICSPPDQWGGRAAVRWIEQLARGDRFAGSTPNVGETALLLDRVYENSRAGDRPAILSGAEAQPRAYPR